MRWLLLACRLVTGGVFLFAAATKLPDLRAFAEVVANYRVVPPPLVPFAAVAVVGVELVAGLALIAGLASRAAAMVTGTLLVVFVAFLAQALLRGIDLRCGCFGGGELATWGTVARDLVLLAPTLLVALQRPAADTNSP